MGSSMDSHERCMKDFVMIITICSALLSGARGTGKKLKYMIGVYKKECEVSLSNHVGFRILN